MTTRSVDTGTDHLTCSITEHVAVLTLDNPKRRNALSDQMTGALARMLTEMEADPDVRVLVLTGAGGAFCAGGDVRSMAASLAQGQEPDPDAMIRNLKQGQDRIALRLFDFAKPTIAALPGPAAGAGMSIALACDLRVAAHSALLVPAFGAIGLSGDFGGSWLLTQLVGPARAKDIYFTGRRILPMEGQDLGLFNRVVSDETLMQDTLALAGELAAAAPVALRYMKANLNRAMSTDFRSALNGEAEHMIRSMLTEDHKNAAQAFVEKRKPDFKGR